MIGILFDLWSLIQNLPWKEISIIVGSILGTGGLAQWYKIRSENLREFDEDRTDFRKELKEEVESLRARINVLEKENKEWRHKFFNQQEQYYEIKRENKDLKHAIKSLESLVDELRNPING